MLADAKKFLFLVPERMEFWGHLIHSFIRNKILVSKKNFLISNANGYLSSWNACLN